MAARDAASLLVGLLVLFLTWGVWADVALAMEDKVEVFRGETAQIACMNTSTDAAMILQWFYVTRTGENQKIYYQDATTRVIDPGTRFTERISVNAGTPGEVMLTISNVQLEDALEFVCIVKSPTDGTGEGRTKLKVFETPDLPTIEGEGGGISVYEDELSKIGTCEVKNGFPMPNITWYRNNIPLHGAKNVVKIVPSIITDTNGLFSVKSELSMKVVKEDKDNTFYCEISYFVPGGMKMTETNRINITVYYPSTAVSVWVESPEGKIKEGDSIKLRCSGNGNDPSSVTTFTYDGFSNANMLVLKNVTRLNSGVYECTSENFNTFEMIWGNTTVFVNYLDSAVVMPKDHIVVAQGEELKATCNALSSLQTRTVWFKKGEEVSKGHSLILKDVTFDTAGTYVCVVTVPEIEGMETNGTLHVNVLGPPKIIKLYNMDKEESLKATVGLSCQVRGYPPPNVTWTTSDGKVLKTASQSLTEWGIQSVVHIKITSDITAFCSASNEYGTDTLPFKIKATCQQGMSSPLCRILYSHINTTTPSTTTTTTTVVPSAKESRGVMIVVIIICILLLAVLGSVLYFLYKKGKICGRSGKQDLTKEKSSKDNIVVEMKSDNTEEAVLLGVNGEKQPSGDQGDEYLDVQK